MAVAFRGRPGALSSGAPTFGFSTGNETGRLPDGALLRITSPLRRPDRGRDDGPLPPDAPAGDALAAAPAGLSDGAR